MRPASPDGPPRVPDERVSLSPRAGSGLRRRWSVAVAASLVVAAGLSGLTGCSAEPDRSAPQLREVAALLARHGQAVRSHDRKAFLADVDGSKAAAAFRRAQAAQFANLGKLPLTRWSYRIDARTGDGAAEAAARTRFGTGAVIVRISLTYALRGADPVPATRALWWTFVRRNGRVVAAADDGLADAGGVSWRGPWDFGPLVVVRGARSLVLGHGSRATLRSVADAVDQAVPAVTAVWGTDWTRYVAVVIPGTEQELGAIVAEASGVTSDVAAAAISDGADPVTGAVSGQRLIVNPEALERLTALGRRIVIRHEVTHIATARETTDSTPRWLIEGFAEYVGNLGSGQPTRVAAAELAADVRAGRLPRQLPTAADFDTGAAAAQAYQASWLACRLIAERAGAPALVRFYRLVGADVTDPDNAVSTALRTILHETPAGFTGQWRRYLRQQLG